MIASFTTKAPCRSRFPESELAPFFVQQESRMAHTSIKSVCPYCGVGCGIVMEVADNRVIKVIGDKDHPSNFGRLCTKGSTCAQALRDSGRLEHAYIRQSRDQPSVRAPLDEAINATAARLNGIIERHGPDAVGIYVSGQMSLEAQYLASKLAKGFIGTNQIESNSRLCMASAASGYKLSLGADGPPGSYADFDHSDLFFVSGANMADCHPILFLRLLDRVKRGARLIVVDPRRSATADKADLFLQLRPGTDLALLNGLLHLLWENGHCDEAFIQRHTDGWAPMPAFLASYTPAHVADVTGLAEADIRQAAQWIGEAGEWMSCWTMGLNQSTHGTWNSNALCNLHLATGKICRPGSGPFSLTGQPNAMGGREMGYMGPGLPGQRSVLNEADRAFVEAAWQVPTGTLHSRVGDGTVALFEDLRAGKVKACWIICSNPVASVANRASVIDALQAAELVVVQDAFLDTETNRYADILLPGALWAEAPGVMINSERNLTLTAQAVPPPGEAMADWQIIARVACAMGYSAGFSHASAAEVFDEITRFANPQTGYDLRGASHARLSEQPLQWPCASGDSPSRQPMRYVEADGPRFPTATGRAQFFARPHLDERQMPDADYPFVLNTGRVQHQWHTLTKTGKIATLNRLNPGPFIEVHPEDAAALDVRKGDRLEIRSRQGRAVLPVVITDRVRPGDCFAPFHWNDLYGENLAINAVTDDAVDPISRQPGFKFCAVSLQRVELLAHRQLDIPSATTPVHDAEAIALLWASQTGNAQALAEDLAARLQAAGCRVQAWDMDDYPLARLTETAQVLLVSSTFGDGDAPDNGQAFWQGLQDLQRPLPGLAFAVLGLGDSSYAQFCRHGRQLHERLLQLGATALLPRVDCDGDSAEAADSWLADLLPVLPRSAEPLAACAPSAATSAKADRIGKDRPYAAPLCANVRLNRGDAEKDTRRLGFDLRGSEVQYQAGDALGIWPRNCAALVDEILHGAGQDGDQSVTVPTLGEMPLREALAGHYEIARPSADSLALLAGLGHRPLRQLLDGEPAALHTWLWGRQLADLLGEVSARPSAEQLLGSLKRLQPRLYSIASSAKAHPGEVHLTVSAVRYGARKGVASTFLADRASDAPVPLFIQPTRHFRVPADGQRPIIMIGPGTGVAPFRAFLQERRACGDSGRNWLFFGEQRRAADFYYEDELLGYQADGLLTRLSLAFSRDQAEKIYVQQRMREEGAELWRWLQDGAHLYICGDASRMAKDVDRALHEVVAVHGGLDEQGARDYVSRMTREKRYLRDVY
jgi:sulfite reductase (NADPH) flavoprotein alpha-component